MVITVHRRSGMLAAFDASNRVNSRVVLSVVTVIGLLHTSTAL